jgi:hypothetical protein
MITKVDEQQPTVIADAMAPTGEANDLADVGVAEVSTGFRAVAVHYLEL